MDNDWYRVLYVLALYTVIALLAGAGIAALFYIPELVGA